MQNSLDKSLQSTSTTQLITQRLALPFDEKEVKFKPQTIKNNRALAIPYVDVRVIQDRLDQVLGVENWQDEFQLLPDGSVLCKLQLKIGDVWITKMDVGSPSEQSDSGDRLKAAVSDALKRAAVKFGIGRYLYRLPPLWVDYDSAKRQFVSPPRLPDWIQQPTKTSSPAPRLIAPTPATPKPQPIETSQPVERAPSSSPSSSPSPAPLPAPSVNKTESTPLQPLTMTGSQSLPVTGAELHRRLREADNQLANQGKCQLGALLSFVTQEGVKAGYSPDLGTWTGPAIEFAVSAVRKFKSKLEASKA